MSVETKELKRVNVIHLSGRIDSNVAADLEQAMSNSLQHKRFNIVVDMENLEYISSRGLRALISGLKETRRWNRGDVRLANVPARILQVLDLAGLTPLFKIYDTSVDAVGSF